MTNEQGNRSTRCISWSAILVGAFVGIGLGYLLNLFTMAIGLSAFVTSPEGVSSFAVGGFIGFVIKSTVSMFVAGMVAGCLAQASCPTRNSGVLYGFTTWCVALMLVISLSTSAERYIGDSTRLISSRALMMGMHNNMPQTIHFSPASASASTSNDIDKGVFALFAISFLAAFASCLGGHMGMTGCCARSCRVD